MRTFFINKNELLATPDLLSDVSLVLTSNILEKMTVRYSQDQKFGKFNIKNGQDHMAIDIDYKYTWPSFESNVEVRSNKIPGEKLNFVTSYKDDSEFKFIMDFPGARALEVHILLPKGIKDESGKIVMTIVTGNPLPTINVKVNFI